MSNIHPEPSLLLRYMKGAKKSETTWFKTRQWEKEIQMLIKHRTETVYDNQKVYTLQLRVANTLFNDIIKGTVLDEVRVNVIPTETQVWKDKLCYGVADPHLHTFDGNNYEMHMPGEYMMYRHTTLNITVQAKTTTCWGVYCFCGIVINAGRDVFMIYVCPDYGVKYDRFIRCEDGLLTASSKGGSEYEVFLSTGTIVKVMIIRSHLINIYIYPSVHDKGKTEGLCGSFDGNPNNDFTFRNGGYQAGTFGYPTPYYPFTYVDDFSNSWKLMAVENLFPHVGVVAKYKSLSPMPNPVQFCYCELNTEEDTSANPTSILKVATCDYREYADCIDTRVRPFICDHYRTESNLETMSEQLDLLDVNQNVRKKKSTVVPYTEAEAYYRCSQGFQDSPIIQLCSGSELIDNSSLSLCVTDLMLTGDDSWIHHQIESARLQCVHAVEFNKTLQREFANLTDEIKSLNCQNNCSGEGSCINGTCICKDGFEEIDCSVNKAEPPQIISTSHRVVDLATHKYSCDRSAKNCQVTDLFGQGFVYDPPPVLRIKKYKITTTYTTDLIKQYTISCTWRGRFEVTCTLDRENLPTDVFVTQYIFEISNDGINFGSEMSIQVFQSTCQEIGHGTAGITYKLKDNYCYIKDVCYANKATEISKSCSICNSTEDKFKWSKSKEDDCLTKSTSEETNDSLTVGLSVGGSILFVVAVAVVVVVVVLKCYKKKICRSNVLTCTPSKDYENHSSSTLFTKRTSSQVSVFSFDSSNDSTQVSASNTRQSKDSRDRPASATSIQLFQKI
ncbi:hypothetical protein KUTeg_011957 [Tegillarca granosa]|uniref:VWFD domain-containing protein n=1 Tax=Tegillarca granosa TaxID=220873 RepID=A0ABQ9F2H7_TEGGR|nr:hypothetical protein KUTeg_011957 [Tegillarca granosa]